MEFISISQSNCGFHLTLLLSHFQAVTMEGLVKVTYFAFLKFLFNYVSARNLKTIGLKRESQFAFHNV